MRPIDRLKSIEVHVLTAERELRAASQLATCASAVPANVHHGLQNALAALSSFNEQSVRSALRRAMSTAREGAPLA